MARGTAAIAVGLTAARTNGEGLTAARTNGDGMAFGGAFGGVLGTALPKTWLPSSGCGCHVGIAGICCDDRGL